MPLADRGPQLRILERGTPPDDAEVGANPRAAPCACGPPSASGRWRHDQPQPRPASRSRILVTGLLVGGLCLLLALNTAAAANELTRHNLAVRDDGVAAQVQQLTNDVAASAAPGALGRAASALGMVPAGNPAFLQVGPNGTVRVLGSPQPAPAAPVPATVPAQPTAAAAAAHSAVPTPTAPAAPAHPTTAAARPGATPTSAVPTAAAPSPAAAPAPTPTPTPTATLPGGPR